MSANPQPVLCHYPCQQAEGQMDVEPLVASDLPPAPTEAAPVSAEIVAPSLPATGKKKKRDGAARNGRQPQAGAPHPGRPEPPNVRDAIMARSGVIDISPALEIKLGAPLDVIIAPCAEIAKIRHATAALVVAAMVSVSMGRAFIRHGLESSDRTLVSGLSLALVSANSAGAAGDLAVQVALQVEAKLASDAAGAGAQPDADVLRDLAAACAARGYELAPMKAAKAPKPVPLSFLLERATLRGLERVWPGVADGLLVVSPEAMPLLPPLAGPIGELQGHLDSLQLGNTTRIDGDARRCSVAVIGSVSLDYLNSARFKNGTCAGAAGRMLWAPSDGVRTTINPQSALVEALTRLRSAKPGDGEPGEFCLDGDAARRFRRVAQGWVADAAKKLPPLRQAYEGAAEMTLRIAVTLHALGAAAANQSVEHLVSEGSIRAAHNLVKASLATADGVLGPLSVPAEISKARMVVQWLRGAKGADEPFIVGEVQRTLSGAVTPLEVRNALKILHENGLIAREEQMSSGRVSFRGVPELFD